MRKEHMIDCSICISEKSVENLCILNVLAARSTYRYNGAVIYLASLIEWEGNKNKVNMQCSSVKWPAKATMPYKRSSVWRRNGLSVSYLWWIAYHTLILYLRKCQLYAFLLRHSIQSMLRKVTKYRHQDALLFSIYQGKKNTHCAWLSSYWNMKNISSKSNLETGTGKPCFYVLVMNPLVMLHFYLHLFITYSCIDIVLTDHFPLIFCCPG